MSESDPQKPSPESPPELRLELRESSGPVSPRFQYELHIEIVGAGQEAKVRARERANWTGGKPNRDVDREEALSEAALAELRQALTDCDVGSLGADLLGEKRDRVGVSVNRFEAQLGGRAPVAFDYHLAMLEDEAPEHARHRAVIAAVKKAAGVG